MMDFNIIDNKLKLLNEYRPLSKAMAKSLKEDMYIKYTYHSNAIEGNTLTLSETKVILEDGITVGGKSLNEHLEAINHKEAIVYLESLTAEKECLTVFDLRSIHKLILKGINDGNAGVFRNESVIITGAEHIPPPHYLIDEQIEKMFKQYSEDWQRLHAVERAAMLHGAFVGIHPFIDGNGRTARLIMNFELIKAGFPPVIIEKSERAKYYETLDMFHTEGDYAGFIQFIANATERSLDRTLTAIEPSPDKAFSDNIGKIIESKQSERRTTDNQDRGK